MRRIIVAGCRDYNNRDFIKKSIIDLIGETPCYNILIITGDAEGVDVTADEIVKEMKLNRAIFPAFWSDYGKQAGMIRNQLMLSTSDELLAFPSKKSIGTRGMISISKKAGKIVKVIEI